MYARFGIARICHLLFAKNRLNPPQEPIPHLVIAVAIVGVVGGCQFLQIEPGFSNIDAFWELFRQCGKCRMDDDKGDDYASIH